MFFIPKWLVPTEGTYVLFSLSIGGGYGTVMEAEGLGKGWGKHLARPFLIVFLCCEMNPLSL